MKNKKFIILVIVVILVLGGCGATDMALDYEGFGEEIGNAILSKESEMLDIENKQDEEDEQDKEHQENDNIMDNTTEIIEDDIVLDNVKEIIENENSFETVEKNGIEIKIKDINNNKKVKENTDSEVYVYIEALDNMEFITLDVELKNISSETIDLKDWAKGITVEIVINHQSIKMPMKSLLDNQLVFVDEKLEVDETVECFLYYHVFEGVFQKNSHINVLIY